MRGTIVYDPPSSHPKPWMAIVHVTQYNINKHIISLSKQGVRLKTPAWGSHITWIRGEKPPKMLFWGNHDDTELVFEITSFPTCTKHGFWYLNIKCEELNRLRYQLGLNPRPPVPFHLTIGKQQ